MIVLFVMGIKGWLINNFFGFVGKKLVPGLLVVSLTALTIGTSFVGIGKVAGSFSSEKAQQSDSSQGGNVQGVSTNSGQIAGGTIDGSPAQNGSLNADGSPNAAGSLGLTAAGLTPQPPAGGSSGSCVVTLFGLKYNITNLLVTHSGGNIFSCGTDMTAMYQSRHGTDVTRMRPYLISSGSVLASGGGISPTPTISPVPSGGGGSCIVTLFGKQYNITNLVKTHSGGNVFACGTDMSSVYQSRHGTDVTRMQGYLINSSSGGGSSPTPTPRPGSNPTPTPTSSPTSTPPPSSGSCIVTLFGIKYDVTNLRNTHSGPRGSFFVCGGDMSSTYQGQHGTNMTRMQPYLLAGATPTPIPGSSPTPTPTKAPSPTPAPTSPPSSGACIVTLFGKQYDVTNLRNTHSGPRGSFFVCGGDMSSTYQGQHGTNMTRMQPYLVTSSGGGGTPTPTPAPGPQPSGVPPVVTLTPTPVRRDD